MKKNIACLAILVAAGVTRVFALTPEIVYVAFNGLDTHPCTRLSPCKTITHALSVVGAGGVVDIVGSGTYDTFTITKSVTVEAEPGVVAAISIPSSGKGITVSAASTDQVALKDLTLQGSDGTGVGVQINSAGRIIVEDCVSQHAAYGLAFSGSGAGFLKVTGGSFEGSDTGIFVVNGNANAAIDRVSVYGGDNHAGIDIAAANVAITRSLVTGEGGPEGLRLFSGTVVLEDDTVSGYSTGVSMSNATAYLSSCTITHNSNFGVTANATTFTRSNNTVIANGTNVSGTLTPFSPQ
jgi:hypothetical protein